MLKLLVVKTLCIAVALVGVVSAQTQKSAPVGKIRTYYVAADEVEWDYAPDGLNK